MVNIHVECLPDETLLKKLGVTRKSITHHTGKSRVFAELKKNSNEIGMVDEDPGSPTTEYQKKLKLIDEQYGIKLYIDNKGNRVLILKIKLEDWIIAICKSAGIKMANFGLPEDPNKLHDIINQRIQKFEKLIDHLLKTKNVPILKLKEWISN